MMLRILEFLTFFYFFVPFEKASSAAVGAREMLLPHMELFRGHFKGLQSKSDKSNLPLTAKYNNGGLEEMPSLILQPKLRQLDDTSSRFMIELYNVLNRDDRFNKNKLYEDAEIAKKSDTIRAVRVTGSRKSRQGLMLVIAGFSLTPGEQIHAAELRLPRRSIAHRKLRAKLTVKAHVSLKDFNNFPSTQLETVTVARDEDGTSRIDVSRLLQRVTSFLMRNASATINRLTLQIGSHRRFKRNFSIANITESLLIMFNKNPTFFTDFSQKISKISKSYKLSHPTRARRRADFNPISIQKALRRKTGRTCERMDFTVDFDEIGWGDWIVYPKKYNAYYCGGRCPNLPTPDYSPTNHALLQALMRRRNKNNAPRPCCVPAKLSSINMLYFERDEYVIRRHENMVVDKCGCR